LKAPIYMYIDRAVHPEMANNRLFKYRFNDRYYPSDVTKEKQIQKN